MTHKKLGLTKDVIVNKVLPFLIPISFDNSLNLQQVTLQLSFFKKKKQVIKSSHI